MNYYPRIRDLREDADLTQKQLAGLLGMHTTTYTNYEQGKREPPLAFIVRLALFYNVTIDYLAGLINTPLPLAGQQQAPCPRKKVAAHAAATGGQDRATGETL